MYAHIAFTQEVEMEPGTATTSVRVEVFDKQDYRDLAKDIRSQINSGDQIVSIMTPRGNLVLAKSDIIAGVNLITEGDEGSAAWIANKPLYA